MSADPRRRDLAVIHMLKKRAFDQGVLDDDGYRALIAGILDDMGTPGDASAATLTASGRARLVLAFGSLGVKLDRAPSVAPGHGSTRRGHWKGRYVGAGQPGFAGVLSQPQANEIARLEDELQWNADPARLLGFIERQVSRSAHVHELTKAEATRVIVGLRRLVEPSGPRRSRASRTKRSA